jgi:hypothetical protein
MSLQIELMAQALHAAETWAMSMKAEGITYVEAAKTWNVDIETYLRLQSLHEAVQPIFHPVDHWRISSRNVIPAQAVMCTCFWVGAQVITTPDMAQYYYARFIERYKRLRREYGPDVFNFGQFTSVFYPDMIQDTAIAREFVDQYVDPASPTPSWAAWRCLFDAGLQHLGYDERPITPSDIALARRNRMAKRR